MTPYIYAIAAGIALAGTLLLLEPPTTSPAPVSAAVATNAREQWAMDFLAALGNAQPSTETVGMVVEWTIAEDGGEGAMNRFNPLNTTICGHNWTGAINSDGACGVGAYGSYQDGINATVDTIDQDNFSSIMIALQSNDPEGAKAALWASPWASSHYGYGASWPAYQAEETQPVSLHKCLPTDTGAISAHFSSTGSQFWAGQAGGMHNGTDFSGNPGDPVYAPFDLTVEDIQYYGDSGRIGWYVQGRFVDGYLFYAGHLGTVAVQVGQSVAACTQIGTIGEVFHTHVKINPPGSPEPCETTGCEDFEQYYATH